MFLVVSNRNAFTQHWKTLLQPASGSLNGSLTRASLKEALTMTETQRLSLAVVDGTQINRNALQANSELAQLAKRTRVLLVEANLGPDAELVTLALGVAGCCSAQLSDAELRKIVDVVLKGGIWISRSALPDLLNHLRRITTPTTQSGISPQLEHLTPREREIALCVAEGATNKVIAKRLSVSDVTVKAHLTTIFHKLGVSGRVQLALLLSSQHQPASPASS